MNYLGTYFPRSFSESYCIFSKYLIKHKNIYQSTDTISVFDFGCGTGGELVGFLFAIKENLTHIKNVEIDALDGNKWALLSLEETLQRLQLEIDLYISVNPINIVVDDFYDMSVINEVITRKYDFVITFKAICEFVTKQIFEQKNPYEHILNLFSPKLSSNGIICMADITTYNDTSKEWLAKMLNNATCEILKIIESNIGYSESFYITHSKRPRDISKIAWKIYKLK